MARRTIPTTAAPRRTSSTPCTAGPRGRHTAGTPRERARRRSPTTRYHKAPHIHLLRGSSLEHRRDSRADAAFLARPFLFVVAPSVTPRTAARYRGRSPFLAPAGALPRGLSRVASRRSVPR